MKRFLLAGLCTTLVLFPMFGYVYACGAMDGIAMYKASKQFHLTLYSMYMFGVADGCSDLGICAALPRGKK